MPAFLTRCPAAVQLRRIVLPRTGKDWILLIVAALVGVGINFLLKHFFPNLSEKVVTSISAVIAAVILVCGGYGDVLS